MSYNFYNISSNDTICDTLSSINANYSNLSNWIIDFQTSYNDNWKPLFDYYNQNSDLLNSTLTIVENNSANWDSFQTTVEVNSARWLQPFTIFYPNIPQKNTDSSFDITPVTDWLNYNFPVKNNDNTINFVENQQAIVSCYTYELSARINNFYKDITDSTTCVTVNGKACARCQTNVTGGFVYCHQGTFGCDYTASVRNCQKSNCFFTYPPYYPLDSNKNQNTLLSSPTALSKIEAQLSFFFTDRYESQQITTISYTVIDCQWFFDKFITA